MPSLPDPRVWSCFRDARLAALVERAVGVEDASRGALLTWVIDRFDAGREDEIRAALREAPSHAAYRALWRAVRAAVESGGADRAAAAVAVQLFAIPIVFVAAAPRGAVVSGAVPDVEALRALLERHGAIGATRNFGIGNALCSREALERLPWRLAYRWTHEWAGPPRELTASELRIEPGRERVYLRFLVGAGVTPTAAPSFLETASNIAAWGLPLAQALVRQMAQPGFDILAIPRPPRGLVAAAQAGRCAELETAFDLFTSNTVRHFRMLVGDPAVVISAHRGDDGGAELRVSLSSPLDDTLLEGFRWPLDPLDDLERIAASITALLAECRLSNVWSAPGVLPEYVSGRLFLRSNEGNLPRIRH